VANDTKLRIFQIVKQGILTERIAQYHSHYESNKFSSNCIYFVTFNSLNSIDLI